MPTIAFRTIRSRQVFVNAPVVRRVLELALDGEVKPHMIAEFKRVVANWRNAPEFQARKFITADEIRVNVFPTGKNKNIYQYVTGGTKPHKIRARNAPTLAFVWGGPGSYKPKTMPGGGYGGPGVVVGGKGHFPKEVNHPGNEPRNFEAKIRKDNERWFKGVMENAWRRAIRAMGS